MRNKLTVFFATLALTLAVPAFAQNVWSLKRAVEYAVNNNLSVKQANINSRQAAINFFQTRSGLLPTASFNNNWNMSFGRRENPTTGIFENTTALASTFSFQTAFNIFNFFSQRNNVEASKYQQQSIEAQEERAKNDIAIRVANAYLLAIQAKEQVELGQLQISLSQEQLGQTRKRIDAGALPELSAAEIEAQLAQDSSTLITSQSNAELQLLQLKAILSLDAGTPFQIEVPDVNKLPLQSLADMQP